MVETITPDGEIIESGNLPAVTDPNALDTILRAELDIQISTAKAYPRKLSEVSKDILDLATLDEETAKECIYALPRGGKPIKGASIRLAEIIAQNWQNCRADARVITTDRINKTITAEGFFHDLEKNSAIKRSITRRIADKRGRLFNEDMINVTGNAACAIAMRNAILAGVPKAVWRKAYEAAEKVITGDIKTLAVRREGAVKAFAAFGVKPEQIFAVLEVAGLDDIGLQHIPTLTGMYSALKNGEATVEEMFDPRRAPAHHLGVVHNPLKDDETDRERLTPDADVAAAGPDTPPAAASLELFVDPIAAAEARGRADRAAGAGPHVPEEWRDKEHSALAAAWLKGWKTEYKSDGEA